MFTPFIYHFKGHIFGYIAKSPNFNTYHIDRAELKLPWNTLWKRYYEDYRETVSPDKEHKLFKISWKQ